MAVDVSVDYISIKLCGFSHEIRIRDVMLVTLVVKFVIFDL